MTIYGNTGRIFNYVKITQFEAKGQQKKPDSVAPSGFSAFLKQNNEVKKITTLECITNKIKFGKRLTRDEMEFLKIHNPELYARAVKIEMEVELKMALFDEFTEFVKSSEFEELPSEHELNDENKNENQNKDKFKKNRFIKDAYLHLPNLQKEEKAGESGGDAPAPQAGQ